MTIVRCWAKSNILPLDKAACINSTFGIMRNTSEEDDVQAILVAMKRITLEVHPCDPHSDETRCDVSEADARRWIDIETNVDVHEAIVCAAWDEVQVDGDSVETDATVEEVNDEARDNEEERAIMPPSNRPNALLLQLENLLMIALYQRLRVFTESEKCVCACSAKCLSGRNQDLTVQQQHQQQQQKPTIVADGTALRSVRFSLSL